MQSPDFARAAVAAPHRSAVEAGRAVLEGGGDAIEAVVAMAAMMAVVYPHMTSLGGDGVWLLRAPSGRLRCIDACGCAGAAADAAAYRAAGYDAVPARGPMAALTVPGALAGWSLALDLSRALGGRLPLADLLTPAARRAREGYGVSAAEARSQPRDFAALQDAPGFAQTFLIEGRWPKAGELRRAEALSATLEQLAHAGLADFYRGDVARELAADLQQLEAPLARRDFETYRARLREPLSLRLPGAALFNSPPPTQGLASLLVLGAFARLDAPNKESFNHIHGLIEASKRAAGIRDRACVVCDRLGRDPADYLSAGAVAREAAQVSMRRGAPFSAAQDAGDTVWMGAADASGLVVSYLQSIFWEYGSGCVLPSTGVHVQNRGCSFSLDPQSVNALAPGARPFHTLSPALAVYDDGDVMAYGSMGGDGQPQFQAQIFSRVAFGDDLAEAIDRPRFLLGRTWGEQSTTLKLESRFDPDLVASLIKAGHDVEVLDAPYSDVCGHAGAVRRHARGFISAAHDPRADGGAAGLG
jgi:oxamate amidohydrolase